jgi:hypothetical protein
MYYDDIAYTITFCTFFTCVPQSAEPPSMPGPAGAPIATAGPVECAPAARPVPAPVCAPAALVVVSRSATAWPRCAAATFAASPPVTPVPRMGFAPAPMPAPGPDVVAMLRAPVRVSYAPVPVAASAASSTFARSLSAAPVTPENRPLRVRSAHRNWGGAGDALDFAAEAAALGAVGAGHDSRKRVYAKKGESMR